MEKKVLKWKEYWTNLTWKSVIVRLVPLMLLALVLGTSPIWADYSKPISVKELPTTAQEMLKEWFPDSRIAFVEKEIEYFSKTYKVILADGMKLEFDRKGEWTTVDAKFHSVPSELVPQPILDYVRALKTAGRVRHIGFSSHTPAVANRLLDTGLVDMMMFSVNPAYDLEQGDELGIGSVSERAALLRRCETMGVGVSVMKPFHGGKLLNEKTSPFRVEMTRYQCLQYALDRPGVLTVVPGVRNTEDLNALLGFSAAAAEEKDYSIIGRFTPAAAQGNCVYCNHCQPCPAGIDVGLVNKYYDLAVAGDKMAAGHYEKLAVKADACIGCGHCDRRCPFHTAQSARMQEIAAYFQNAK